MSIGENIRKRRIDLGMSQQQLAESLGYRTRSSIAKIESNQSGLSPEKIISISHVLRTTTDYILHGISTPDSRSPGSVISHNELAVDKQAENRKCVAVILAGGKTRINQYSIPYQFVSVREKPIVIYTMEAFQRHPQIDEIHVVCLDGWEDFLRRYAEKYNLTKLREIIPAGNSGVESVKNAVEWLRIEHTPYDLILIQEATRPFVEPETIANAILCCKKYGSAIVFERLDSLTPFLINESGSGLTHLNANHLVNVQSPEVYTLGTLRQAFAEAEKINHPLTETICAVFLYHLGRNIRFCEGNHNNLRIVSEDDIKILNALL